MFYEVNGEKIYYGPFMRYCCRSVCWSITHWNLISKHLPGAEDSKKPCLFETRRNLATIQILSIEVFSCVRRNGDVKGGLGFILPCHATPFTLPVNCMIDRDPACATKIESWAGMTWRAKECCEIEISHPLSLNRTPPLRMRMAIRKNVQNLWGFLFTRTTQKL